MCVGEINADIVVKPVSGIDFATDSVIVSDISVHCGGDAMNTAIGLAKLSHEVLIVGRCGKDVLGELVVNKANSYGVQTNGIVFSETKETSKVLVAVNPQGKRCFLHQVGANSEFCLSDVPYSLLKQCGHLHIGGTFHLDKFDGEAAANLLKSAKELGLTTSMDVAYDHHGRWMELIECCLPYLTYFLPSLDEARRLTEEGKVENIVEVLRNKGIENVVIKMGKKGTYTELRDGKKFCIGIYPVVTEDETGAGDGFLAGFLSGIADSCSIENCVVRGSALAAFIVQKVGATQGVPTKKVLLQYIKNTNKPEIKYG
jgi:sugar/nucleoside kinase (ribokinase family)